jgi:hypothetical protein
MEYSSEKIDQFVAEAEKQIANIQKIYSVLYTKVSMLTIAEVMEEQEKIQKIAEAALTLKKLTEKYFNKYYDITDMYESIYSQPQNVQTLYKYVDILDDLYDNMSYLTYAIDNIVEAGQDLSRISPPSEN